MIGDDYQNIPINDIDTVIFSHNKVVITIPLIVRLLENNVNILICDSKNDPIGVFNAFNGHSLVFKQLNAQINWKVTRKKKLWRKIIADKIQSEIDILRFLGVNSASVAKLKEYKNSIYNDDLTNREAASAKLYFKEIFGKDFYRDDGGDAKNYALNYGYKIVASHISKCITSRGLIAQLGIHHVGESNPFNLTYDFIEPVRALIDLWVLQNVKDHFGNSEKQRLIELMSAKVKINGMWFRLNDAIEDVIDSYIAFLNEEKDHVLRIDLKDGYKQDD